MEKQISPEVARDEEIDFHHSADLLASTSFIHGESIVLTATRRTYESAIDKRKLSLGKEVVNL